jgi:hypothetical protein
MVRVDLDTIKMTRWLWASGRRSQLAKHGSKRKETLPPYDTGCAENEGINVRCQDGINDATSSESGQLSLGFAGSLVETV